MVEWRGQSDEPLGRISNDMNVFFVSTDYVSRHQFGGPKLGIMKKSLIARGMDTHIHIHPLSRAPDSEHKKSAKMSEKCA